jgi:hypothetical protein
MSMIYAANESVNWRQSRGNFGSDEAEKLPKSRSDSYRREVVRQEDKQLLSTSKQKTFFFFAQRCSAMVKQPQVLCNSLHSYENGNSALTLL